MTSRARSPLSLALLLTALLLPGTAMARNTPEDGGVGSGPLALRVNPAIAAPGGLVAMVLRTYAPRPIKQGQVSIRVVARPPAAAVQSGRRFIPGGAAGDHPQEPDPAGPPADPGEGGGLQPARRRGGAGLAQRPGGQPGRPGELPVGVRLDQLGRRSPRRLLVPARSVGVAGGRVRPLTRPDPDQAHRRGRQADHPGAPRRHPDRPRAPGPVRGRGGGVPRRRRRSGRAGSQHLRGVPGERRALHADLGPSAPRRAFDHPHGSALRPVDLHGRQPPSPAGWWWNSSLPTRRSTACPGTIVAISATLAADAPAGAVSPFAFDPAGTWLLDPQGNRIALALGDGTLQIQ